MRTAKPLEECVSSALCAQCGIPTDAKTFDVSSFAAPPAIGDRVVLARFELPPQYCGVLEYFSQFTDAIAQNAQNAETPGFEWSLLLNRERLYPYLQFQHIVNPWGFGSFPVSIRLEDSGTLELEVRGVPAPARAALARIGGRILGRYWYNAAYGDVVRRGE